MYNLRLIIISTQSFIQANLMKPNLYYEYTLALPMLQCSLETPLPTPSPTAPSTLNVVAM